MRGSWHAGFWPPGGNGAAGGIMLVGCSAKALTQPSWPAPPDPMKLSRDAGFDPTDREFVTTHTHAHLDIFVDGQRVTVPAGIGIDIAAKGIAATKTPDGTGMDYQVSVCDAPCLSELHTHDRDGIVHNGSSKIDQEPHTLGQFFKEWAVRLDDSCVGEFCEIKLTPHLEVAIVIGKAPGSHSRLMDLPGGKLTEPGSPGRRSGPPR